MRAVDIGVERGKLIFETVAHKALRGQVIALIRQNVAHDLEQRRIALEGGRMQLYIVLQVADATQALFRGFDCDSSDNPMNFIAFFEQQLGKVGTVLTGNSGY